MRPTRSIQSKVSAACLDSERSQRPVLVLLKRVWILASVVKVNIHAGIYCARQGKNQHGQPHDDPGR